MGYQFVNADQLNADLTTVANAIRAKGGTTEPLTFPAGMEAAVSQISAGDAWNFEVVGNPQPSNPRQNTIWVDAENITGYYFSVEQPENMQPGEVWFLTGKASTVAFNAAKNGYIMLYPISAKQMVGGALVDVTAKSWQNGAWVEWIEYLFRDGNQFEDLTGGWSSAGYTYSGWNVVGASVDETILLSTSGKGTRAIALAGTQKKINLTDKTKILARFTSPGMNNATLFGVCTTKVVSSSIVANVLVTSAGVVEIPLVGIDSGEYYIIAYTSSAYGDSIAEIEEIWFE